MQAITRHQPRPSESRVILLLPAFFLLMALTVCGALIGTLKSPTHALAARGVTAAHLNLAILMSRPGTNSGPAYYPADFTLPAHTRVTVTIVNQDPGDTALPTGSPFSSVTGTAGNLATVDGVPYSALADEKVAHTFTIPALGLNVPIPGDAPAGHQDITVSFSFVTGKAGTYMWQCFDPCGGGAGWDAPMGMMGYMMGTLTVQ